MSNVIRPFRMGEGTIRKSANYDSFLKFVICASPKESHWAMIRQPRVPFEDRETDFRVYLAAGMEIGINSVEARPSQWRAVRREGWESS